jgi:arabinogalactan oligomer / maltooligosaccharide transport system permease protein
VRTPPLIQRLLVHGALLVIIMGTLYPVLWVLKMALTASQGFSLSALPIPWPPSSITLDNFRYVLATENMAGDWLFGHQLLNSVIVSAATMVFGIVLACTAGYAFSRFSFPGQQAGLKGMLVTQMFPGVVMAIPLYILLDSLHLLNNLVGLCFVYSTTAIPFCVWNLKGYFDTIPKDLEEAAVMDGASQWTIFIKVILPLSRPAIAVTALFCFMTAWNEFILAATFMSAETAYTLPVALQSYVGDYSTEWGHFAAGAVLVSIPVMALFMVLQRHLVEGLTAGGVKG